MGKQDIIKALQHEVKRANAKLQRLQGHYGTKQLYASKKLYKNLMQRQLIGDVITEKGFIKFNKNLTEMQMRYILKQTKAFNEAKTSTVKGIEQAKETTKQSIRAMLEPDEIFGLDIGVVDSIEDSDVESLFAVFSDSDTMEFIERLGYSVSEFWQEIHTVERQKLTEQSFIQRYTHIIDIDTDADEVDMLKHIYNKYIR